MSTPKTYTERVAVSVPVDLRAEMESKLPAETGLTAALRDAALRSIGRKDLILGGERNESGHRARRKTAAVKRWVFIAVRMTKHQRMALTLYAKDKGKSLSFLMLEALRKELGLPAERDRAQPGYPLGKRRSSPPAKAAATKKKRARKKKA